MSISDRFQRLLQGIQPTERELATYDSHRSTVRQRVLTAFPGSEVEVIGSHARNTAISGSSDLDLMLKLRRDEARWGGSTVSSDTILRRVRDDLQARYGATDIRRDGQAVAVKFGGGAFSVDVVPAMFAQMFEGRPAYVIPDGAGGWLTTSPQAHNRYLAEENNRSRGKLRSIAQLIKFWRECRSPKIPLQSFHVELVLASEGICAGVKSYAECLADAFDALAARNGRALQDPIGISGLIPAANTPAKRSAVANALASAADHATRACEAEHNRNTPEAVRQWNIVFNNSFASR